jgi:hypothetical protein
VEEASGLWELGAVLEARWGLRHEWFRVLCLTWRPRCGTAFRKDGTVGSSTLPKAAPLDSASMRAASTDPLGLPDPRDPHEHMRDTREDSSTQNLLAAVAREQLVRGQSITPRALAALASVSEENILELIRSGELSARELVGGENRIDSAEAARWLATTT